MREPPEGVADADVREIVRRLWRIDVAAVEHLPVGFGAHHWSAATAGQRVLFVTLDHIGPRHSAASLEAAYAAAAALAGAGCEFVARSLPHRDGAFTAPLAGGLLSCVTWIDGTVAGEGPVPDERLAQHNAGVLARLHAAAPPVGIPVWRPVVRSSFGFDLAVRLAEPWAGGPYGEAARARIGARTHAIDRWTARYHELVHQARQRPWVATHGEPHTRNQLITADGVVLVDWETLALAPRERDLRPLVASGYAGLVAPDWDMIELFDLEWRLDEVAQYATWFAAPHSGTESDAVAYAGLGFELDRPAWTRPWPT